MLVFRSCEIVGKLRLREGGDNIVCIVLFGILQVEIVVISQYVVQVEKSPIEFPSSREEKIRFRNKRSQQARSDPNLARGDRVDNHLKCSIVRVYKLNRGFGLLLVRIARISRN